MLYLYNRILALMKKNTFLLWAAWMNITVIILTEQTKKYILFDSTYLKL